MLWADFNGNIIKMLNGEMYCVRTTEQKECIKQQQPPWWQQHIAIEHFDSKHMSNAFHIYIYAYAMSSTLAHARLLIRLSAFIHSHSNECAHCLCIYSFELSHVTYCFKLRRIARRSFQPLNSMYKEMHTTIILMLLILLLVLLFILFFRIRIKPKRILTVC